MLILAHDTETTGMPDWNEPSEGEQQPHIVQLCAKLVDTATYNIIAALSLIVKPDGWVIPADATAVHRISNGLAETVGVPEDQLLEMYLQMHYACELRVGHNVSFDDRIIRIAIKRLLKNDELADKYKEAPKFCTMKESTDLLKLPGKRGGYKWPTLEEAYEFFTGKKMENAHNAEADVDATIEVYKALHG